VYARQLDDIEAAKRIADSLPVGERALVMAETFKLYPPTPEGCDNVKRAIGHLLLLFGNNAGYQLDQHVEKGINELIGELEGFKKVCLGMSPVDVF